MATIATFGNGSYNPSYVSSSVNNGVTTETWNKFTVVKDSSGTITWNDIAGNYPEGNEPRKFNVTQTTSQPSITYGNGDSVNITNKNGWYLHSFTGSNTYLGYSIITIVPSTGGGTSTEGSSYSGTLTVNGTSLEYEIPATSSSGTYELKADDTTQLSIVHGSTASTGSAPNFDQTKIWTLISPMGDELDEIDLTGSGGSSTKKVFCNFW